MEEFVKNSAALSAYAWPVVSLIVFVCLFPLLKRIVSAFHDRGGTVKIGNAEITLQESSKQLGQIVISLTDKISQIEEKLKSSNEPEIFKNKSKSGSKLLWVDDNPNNNAYLRAYLEQHGSVVDIAISTEMALGKLSVVKFDAIISDMDRNGDDRAGINLLKKLRTAGDQIPFVFYCSPWAANNFSSEVHEAGAQGITSSSQDLIAILSAYDFI